MSKDKYPSIFSPQMVTNCLYYPSNLFSNMRSFENWGIFSDIPQFQLGNIRSRDVFRPIAREQKDLMDYNRKYSQTLTKIPHTILQIMSIFFKIFTVFFFKECSIYLLISRLDNRDKIFTVLDWAFFATKGGFNQLKTLQSKV